MPTIISFSHECGDIYAAVYKLKRRIFDAAYHWPTSTLREVLNKHGAWVAYHNNRPIGYLMAWPQRRRRCHIGGVAVRREFQGQGIGAQLIALAERHYRRRGYKQINLDVDVNNAAQLLYYRSGFRVSRLSKKHNFISMSKEI